MQTFVCSGVLILAVIVVIILRWTGRGGSAYQRQGSRGSAMSPYQPGQHTPDVGTGGARLTPTQAANRRELAQGVRLGALTDQDIQVLERPAHTLKPGEASIQVLLSRRVDAGRKIERR